MDPARRERLATLSCVLVGAAGLALLALVDGSGVNPDVQIAVAALAVAAAVVALGFAARVARPRFFVLGIGLAELTFFAVWTAIAAYNGARTHG